MGTPKKTVNKKPASNSTGAKKSSSLANTKPQKRFIDDDDDDEFDAPLDELDYEALGDGYDDDDDYKF